MDGDSAVSLNELFQKHNKAALAFSGGKESLVLAHMLLPYKDCVELIWVNTGAMFPHMEEFIRSYGRVFKLTELKSDQKGYISAAGLPSRIVPIYNTPLRGAAGIKIKVMIGYPVVIT